MDNNHRISSSYIEAKAHNSHRIVVTLDHLNGILFSIEACCGTCHYFMVYHCSFLNDQQGTDELKVFSLVMISWEGESTFSMEISSLNSFMIAWKEETLSREDLVLVQVNVLMIMVLSLHFYIRFKYPFWLNDHTFDRHTLFLFSTNSSYLDETLELR